jgi:hypothetical protein
VRVEMDPKESGNRMISVVGLGGVIPAVRGDGGSGRAVCG